MQTNIQIPLLVKLDWSFLGYKLVLGDIWVVLAIKKIKSSQKFTENMSSKVGHIDFMSQSMYDFSWILPRNFQQNDGKVVVLNGLSATVDEGFSWNWTYLKPFSRPNTKDIRTHLHIYLMC